MTALNLNPKILSADLLGGGYIIPQGCSTIYNAMAGALGSDRVVLNAQYKVKRDARAVQVTLNGGNKWGTGDKVTKGETSVCVTLGGSARMCRCSTAHHATPHQTPMSCLLLRPALVTPCVPSHIPQVDPT